MRRALAVAAFALLWLALAAVAMAAAVPVPALTARVIDQTGTLDAGAVQSLDATLASFERSKGSQIAVLIVPTTGDETIEQYSIRVVDAWKLGRKGVDDGALLIVAKNDRKVRIEVGRGLEGVIPDAIANRIIGEDIAPRFKQGDFAGGLRAGVDRMIGLVNGEPLPPPRAPAEGDGVPNGDGPFLAALVAFLFARVAFHAFRPLLRGGLAGGIVCTVAVFAGASFGYALALGFLAFLIGLVSGGSGGGMFSSRGGSGGWGGWSGGSSGGFGGGGGFSGGGGGFSGGGASGGW